MFKRTLRSESGGWSGVFAEANLPSWAHHERLDRAAKYGRAWVRADAQAAAARRAARLGLKDPNPPEDEDAKLARERGFPAPGVHAAATEFLKAHGLTASGSKRVPRERKARVDAKPKVPVVVRLVVGGTLPTEAEESRAKAEAEAARLYRGWV